MYYALLCREALCKLVDIYSRMHYNRLSNKRSDNKRSDNKRSYKRTYKRITKRKNKRSNTRRNKYQGGQNVNNPTPTTHHRDRMNLVRKFSNHDKYYTNTNKLQDTLKNIHKNVTYLPEKILTKQESNFLQKLIYCPYGDCSIYDIVNNMIERLPNDKSLIEFERGLQYSTAGIDMYINSDKTQNGLYTRVDNFCAAYNAHLDSVKDRNAYLSSILDESKTLSSQVVSILRKYIQNLSTDDRLPSCFLKNDNEKQKERTVEYKRLYDEEYAILRQNTIINDYRVYARNLKNLSRSLLEISNATLENASKSSNDYTMTLKAVSGLNVGYHMTVLFRGAKEALYDSSWFGQSDIFKVEQARLDTIADKFARGLGSDAYDIGGISAEVKNMAETIKKTHLAYQDGITRIIADIRKFHMNYMKRVVAFLNEVQEMVKDPFVEQIKTKSGDKYQMNDFVKIVDIYAMGVDKAIAEANAALL